MSCNFLTSRLVDVNKNCDTLSEVSESGTGTSGWNSNWDSREELQDLIAKLGLRDVADLYQDRFRVDRKKLEQMLTGEPINLIFIIYYEFIEKSIKKNNFFDVLIQGVLKLYILYKTIRLLLTFYK